MSKHTPGPWTEVGRYIETHGYILCEMFSARTREERDANQRLIAAVPELLEALKNAIEIIEGTGLDASIQRAAIAKATGEDEV